MVFVDTQFDAIVQAVIHDWPDYGWSGQLEAAVSVQIFLIQQHGPANAARSSQDHAGDDALLLTTSLDDLIDTVTDRAAITEFSPIVTMRPCFSKRRDETQSTNWSSASWLTYLPIAALTATVLEGQMAL